LGREKFIIVITIPESRTSELFTWLNEFVGIEGQDWFKNTRIHKYQPFNNQLNYRIMLPPGDYQYKYTIHILNNEKALLTKMTWG
jgi:hypothetical protein